jgi:hypothetical protein
MAEPQKVSELPLLAAPTRDDHLLLNDAAGPATYRATIDSVLLLAMRLPTLGEAPDPATWTWINKAGSASVKTSSVVFVNRPATGGGNNVGGLMLTAPAAPYTLTVGLLLRSLGGSYSAWGLGFSDGTKMLNAYFNNGGGATSENLDVNRQNSPTSFNATVFTAAVTHGNWLRYLRAQHDGTNLKFHHSADGLHWLQLYSEAAGAFLTPTHVGYAFGNEGSNPTNGMSIIGYEQT